MRFSIASLFSGVLLIVAPLIAYSYQLHVLEVLTATIMSSHDGTLDLPDVPTVWYAVSCAFGAILIALGCMMEMLSTRSSSGTGKQAVAV